MSRNVPQTFADPFRYENGKMVTVDQGSEEDILGCVKRIVAMPDFFGVEDTVDAILEIEPRASREQVESAYAQRAQEVSHG